MGPGSETSYSPESSRPGANSGVEYAPESGYTPGSAPTQEYVPVQESAPTQEYTPVKESGSTQEYSPVQESASTQEYSPVQESAPTQEYYPQQESAPVQGYYPEQVSASEQGPSYAPESNYGPSASPGYTSSSSYTPSSGYTPNTVSESAPSSNSGSGDSGTLLDSLGLPISDGSGSSKPESGVSFLFSLTYTFKLLLQTKIANVC